MSSLRRGRDSSNNSPPPIRSPLQSKKRVQEEEAPSRKRSRWKRRHPVVVEEEAPSRKWSRWMRRHPVAVEEVEAPSRNRWQWSRPLRPCSRDDVPLIQHLPRTRTLEFQSDYYCCEFPQELLREILVRLPSVECIIKCTAVCKSWWSVIKSPTFIDAHLSRSRNRNQNRNEEDDASVLLLQRGLYRLSYELYWDKPSAFGFGGEFFPLNNANSKSVVFPEVFRSNYDREIGINSCENFNMAGTCNGLICFATNSDWEYKIPTIIINPLLRKFVALPRPSIAIPDQDDDGSDDDEYNYVGETSWFCYDPRTNDYKVLRILGASCSGPAGDTPFGVELYSLASGSWKTLSPAAFPGGLDMFARFSESSHVFCNGALHWLLRDKNYKENVLLSFDVATESFHAIDMPEALRSFCRCRIVFLSIHEEDSLALIEVDRQCPEQNDLHLWVMQQYGVGDSWTKLSSISLGDLYQYSAACPTLFGFKRNGEHMFKLGYRRGCSGSTVLLNVDFKTVNCGGFDRRSEFKFIDSFVESLALLNQPNALSY